ncbi:MAG: ATP--guanido phosphotransferase [Planctomyces sp.]|nr:ATP--guanido phosphotransferase [Planctomyces sp.]
MEALGPLCPESVKRGADWLGGGAESDVVISSRVRLARNLAAMPFPARCDAPQRARAVDLCREQIQRAAAEPGGRGWGVAWLAVHELSAIDRRLLVERHLMSKELAEAEPADAPRGLAVSVPDERLSIMVNEEDLLRLQVIRSGLALTEASAQLDAVDTALDARLNYAFHPRFGYLTACPTNVGSGVRMSVMLHLPGIRLMGEVDKIKRAARDMALTVRGFYGERSEAAGDLFQLSNQTTLGRSEEGILRDLLHQVIPDVVRAERDARRRLLESRRRVLEDQVFRALGVLRTARLLPPDECLANLSLARLGVTLGLLRGIDLTGINRLFVLTQPAHLQRLLGQELDQQQRREARADYVRSVLSAVG